MPESLTAEAINNLIHIIGGQRVMFDADLAHFYGVATKVLNQAVRRNIHRFPKDFAFQPKREELTNLRSQFVTSSLHGGSRYRPWVFTEHGAVMLASVLNSAVAIAASVEIVRAFVQLRNTVALSSTGLVSKLIEMEKRLGGHDAAIAQLFGAIRQLLEAPKPSPNKQPEIGFHVREEPASDLPPLSVPRKTANYKALRRKPARRR